MQDNSPWMGVFLLPASTCGAWAKKQHVQVERGYFMVWFHMCGFLHLQSPTGRICAAFFSDDSCSFFALAYQVSCDQEPFIAKNCVTVTSKWNNTEQLIVLKPTL